MGAKYLASNPIFHGRMKHVETDYHFSEIKFFRYCLMLDLFQQMSRWLTTDLLSPYRREGCSSSSVILT
jgi:hypothetical protein